MFFCLSSFYAFFLGSHCYLRIKKKNFFKKIILGLLGVFYCILGLFLFTFPNLLFFSIGIIFSLLLILILQKKDLPFIIHLCSLLFLLLACSISIYPRKKPSLFLHITGNTQKEEVEWKFPNKHLEKKTLTGYEVEIDFQGTKKTEVFLGELIGIRYKKIELIPLLHLIGCNDPVEIQCIQSDYTSFEKIGSYPITTIRLEEAKKGFDYVHSLIWKNIFYKKCDFFWIRSASIKTEYFPLVDEKGIALKGSYDLINS